MTGDLLTLEHEPDEGAVWLIVTSSLGSQRKELLRLRRGFGVDDVYQAIIASGSAKATDDGLRLTSPISCESLRDLVEAILGYFDEPGVPSVELLEVQSAAGEYEQVRDVRGKIPLHAYAWLDLAVRDDLADEARSSPGIWSRARVALELASYCDRRVAELVARFAQQPEVSAMGPLAPSLPTRHAVSRTKWG